MAEVGVWVVFGQLSWPSSRRPPVPPAGLRSPYLGWTYGRILDFSFLSSGHKQILDFSFDGGAENVTK